jgi:hypothetical protein
MLVALGLCLVTAASATTTVTRCDERGVVVAFDFGAVSLRDVVIPGVPGNIVELADCIRYEVPGLPDLPQLRVMCGVAQEGKVSLSVTSSNVEDITDCEVAPAVTFFGDGDAGYPRAESYARPGYWPAQLGTLEGVELLRDVRVARVLVSPVQYDAVEHRLRVYHHVEVRLEFEKPAQERGQGSGVRGQGAGDPFERLYPEMLVNGEKAKEWKVGRQGSPETGSPKSEVLNPKGNPNIEVRNPKDSDLGFRASASSLGFPSGFGVGGLSAGSFFDRSRIWVKVRVESTGVYRISFEDLQRQGIDPSLIDPRTFQLYTLPAHQPNGEFPDTLSEVSLAMRARTDSAFRPHDYLLFYGRAVSGWNPGLDTFTRNLYTRDNCYWLTWGVAPGRRMVEGIGTPVPGEPAESTGFAKVRVEQDHECPARSGLLWVWSIINKVQGAATAAMDFDLGLQNPVRLLQISGRFFSTVSKTNHLNMYLNHVLLDSFEFANRPYSNPYAFGLSFDSLPCPGLDSVHDVLNLELVGDSTMQAYVDYFDVSYEQRLRLNQGRALSFFARGSGRHTFAVRDVRSRPLVLNVDNPRSPRLITEWQYQGDSLRFSDFARDTSFYLVTDTAHLLKPVSLERRTPGRLRAESFDADYLIVAPDQLYDEAQVLARFRTNNVAGLAGAQVRAVRLSEVYDDFGFGLEEPMATKQFLTAKRPFYGLLLGDATYDYRDNLGLHPAPGVPPYEIGYDLDPTVYAMNAVALDCWYADFDGSGYTPDMFLGRVTARTPEELAGYLQKLIKYENGERGFWCKRTILVSDDEFLGYPSSVDPIGLDHISYNEIVNSIIGAGFEATKVYLTEYPLVSIKDKPGARADLIKALQRGGLLFSFFGHGSGDILTHENVLTLLSIPLLNNAGRSPFCFFGSCGVGRWEDSKAECIAEELVRKPDGGAIASVGASKSTSSYSNLAFAQRLFASLMANQRQPVGPAYAAALPNGTLYHLFGDPATLLDFPDSGGNVTLDRDTLRSGQLYRFGGASALRSGYAAAELFGDKWLRTYYSCSLRVRPRPVTYVLAGDELFHGISRIGEGVFQGGFVAPVGIQRGPRYVPDGSYLEIDKSARLSVAAWNGTELYSVLRDTLEFDTTCVTSSDVEGPEITLFADGQKLSPADTNVVPASFELLGRLRDTSGVLVSPMTGGDGMYLYVNDFRNRVELNQSFLYELDSHTTGSFMMPVTVGSGEDSIVVSAADNFLNRTTARVAVRAQDVSKPAVMDVLVYPNPVSSKAWFTFRLSVPAAVTVRVFTLAGRPVRTIEEPDAQAGFNQLAWDGCDRVGAPLPNGVYLYVVTARIAGTFSGRHQNTETSVRDKFLVRR